MTMSKVKKQILRFHLKGKREYQEDTWFVSTNENLFIICDGVGGANKGNVASNTVTNYIGGQLNSIENIGIADVTSAIEKSAKRLKEMAIDNHVMANMATTIALLHLSDNNAIVAHVGDSRIYHYDPYTDKLSCTKDHSLVQELFDLGVIKTEEEMSKHPMKNRITRALSSTLNKEAYNEVPTVEKIENIREGSVFLLCSDGVTESASNDDILLLLKQPNLEEAFLNLKQSCIENSKDNSTCIIVKV